MPEVIHFRDSDKIIKEKGLEPGVSITLENVEAMLYVNRPPRYAY
jgi:hypothetical protein